MVNLSAVLSIFIYAASHTQNLACVHKDETFTQTNIHAKSESDIFPWVSKFSQMKWMKDTRGNSQSDMSNQTQVERTKQQAYLYQMRS